MLPIMEVKRPFSDKHWLDTPEPVKAYTVFPILANAIDSYFNDKVPDVLWVTATD